MSVDAYKFVACLALASSLAGCGSDDDGNATGSAARGAVVKNYAAQLYTAYSDSVTDEAAFLDTVKAFIAAPTEKTLGATRQGWVDSREHYMLTEGARFSGGPIDGEIDGAPNYEGLVNSWPLDEAYIDYKVEDGVLNEDTGIINLPQEVPEITAEALDLKNAEGGDENVSAGYHAVEFLLWGQALKPSGPGERPATDYSLQGPTKNPDRRAAYLTVAVQGIADNLTAVRDAWAPTASYRVAFEKNTADSLTRMFTGLAKFSKGELGSQRIGAAYKSKERHDQHDCFSSQTLLDYERDARGIQGLYLGKYGDNDGPGLDDLVKAANPALDVDLKKKLQASIDAIVAIPKPFEDAIAGDDDSIGRVSIQKALNALSDQGDAFGLAAKALGLTIVVDDPAP